MKLATDICRVCLTKSKKLRSLYESSEVDEVPPNIMIEQVTGIHVEEMMELPMLPKNICKNCELSLSMAYEFRVKTIKSKRIIDLYLNNFVLNDMQQQSQSTTIKNVINNGSTQSNLLIKEEDIELGDLIEVDAFDEDNFNSGDINDDANNCDIQLHSHIINGYDDYNDNRINGRKEINGYDVEQLEDVSTTHVTTVENIVRDHDDDDHPSLAETDVIETEIEEEESDRFYDVSDHDNNVMEKIEEEKLEVDKIDEFIDEHFEMKKSSQSPELSITIHENLKRPESTNSISEENNNEPEIVLNPKGTKTKNRKNTSLKREFPYICDICGNVYTKRSRMMEHRQRHDKELKYACELCDKKFHLRELLRKHMYSHNGGKPLKCQYCSRTFYYESVRKAHENVHKGLRPYVCEDCGKSFCYAHTLKKHKLIHTETKQYHCKYCNKNFRLQHHMKQHELTKLHKNAVVQAKGQQQQENLMPVEKLVKNVNKISTKEIYVNKIRSS